MPIVFIRWFLYSSISLILLCSSGSLIINKDLREKLFYYTVLVLNIHLGKGLSSSQWPSLVSKIKVCTISSVLNLSSSHWSQWEYWRQQDLEKTLYSEKVQLKSNWIFRNSCLTRTCKMSNVPSGFQFSGLKWHFKCKVPFLNCRLCEYLSHHFQPHLLNAIINPSFLYYANLSQIFGTHLSILCYNLDCPVA